MSSPLTGIKTEIDKEQRRQEEKNFALHRPYATSIMQDLRKKLLEAVRNQEAQVFVMSWDWVPEELDEKIEGLGKVSVGVRVPDGSELQGAERLVYDECIKEGLHVTIEAPEPAEGVVYRFLHMYVCL